MAKKQFFYSPYTGEIIKESKKMDWYGVTDIVPPEVKENESLIFKDGVWIVEKSDNSEQLKSQKRAERDILLKEMDIKVQIYTEQKQIGLEVNEDDHMKLLRYKQYLRDIPQMEEFPDVEILSLQDFN